MWKKVKSAASTLRAAVRDTLIGSDGNGNAIDDDDDNNYAVDNSGKDASSQPAFIEISLLRSDVNRQQKFPDNSIRTAKYTLVSGLPLSLLYQFYKISNFYFLLVMIIALVPGASPINPFSSVVPLCIVLGAGIIKDLWEDWKRRKADQQANQMLVHVLRVSSTMSQQPDKPGHHHTSHREETSTTAAVLSAEEGEIRADSSGNTSHVKHRKGSTTSDSEKRNNDSRVTAPSIREGNPPGNDRKPKRVVRFTFPSDRSRSKSSTRAGDESASPHRSTEMAPFNEKSQTSVASRPALIKTHTRNEAMNGAAASSSAAATANAAPTAVHRPSVTFHPIRSCDVYPGDVMLFRLGEEVKADCLLLNTSLPDGLTYIETANLDGETNAKTRRAKIQTVEALGTVEDIVERSLGVPASNAAAVSAKMNGTDSTDGAGANAGGMPPKAKMNSCGGTGAQEANSVLAATSSAQGVVVRSTPALETSDSVNPPARVPELTNTAKMNGTIHVPDLRKHQQLNNKSCGSTRDGEDPTRQQQLHHSYSQATPHLFMNGTDSATMSAMAPVGDSETDRGAHSHHLTLDERLVEDGIVPVPRSVCELSAQYERALHSRTSSLGHHHLSSTRAHHAEMNMNDEAGLACLEGGSAHHHHHHHDLPDDSTDPEKTEAASVVSQQPPHGVVLVSCAPTPDLSTWFGQLRMPSGEMVPLGIDQFIPRGCVIRNTDWVLGAVVYTGRHTKMLLNLRPKPNKITNMARRLNQLNVFLFVLNQLLMFLLCGLAVWNKHYLLRQLPGTKTKLAAWYIQWSLTQYSDVALFWWRYLTNFVLLSYLIPMSLYVTLEFNKAMQMLMIGADKRMAVYDEFTGAIKKARPKTSELNSQLGHVRYIFTDKTGTLTENLMTYVGGVVDGHTHSETERPGGIGRALLKRCSGAGNNNSNSRRPISNMNTLNGASSMIPRFLSMNSAIGDDHHHFGSVVNISLNDAPPQRSLAADGGETPNAAPTGPGGAALPTSNRAGLTLATYQMPTALVSPPSPSMARGFPLPSSAQGRAQHRGTRSIESLSGVGWSANNISTPAFGSPYTPGWNSHARIGSGVNFLQTGSSATAGGLSHVSEALLERDPVFRYLRALALCHSVVCFPVYEESNMGSESDEKELLNRTAEDVAVHNAVDGTESDGTAAPLTKEERKQRRQVKKAEREARRAQRRREDSEYDEADNNEDGTKKSCKHQHHKKEARAQHHHVETASHATRPDAASAHPTAAGAAASHDTTTAGRHQVPSALSFSNISPENFVEIPYAVPAGPIREVYEPYHSTPDLTAPGGHGENRPFASASSASLAITSPPLFLSSQSVNPLNVNRMHGRTSSASWYHNRYLSRVTHSRNLSQNSNMSVRLRTMGSGGPNTPLSVANNRVLRNGLSSRKSEGDASGVAGPAGGGSLEPFIDRTKIYEGQSLDEIALVNAARENGFSLFERSAKQMYVKALGRVMCYDIIAELEFTPQRKLMSILLQRQPELDTEGAATSAAMGKSSDYHRKTEADLVASQQSAPPLCGGGGNMNSNNNNATALATPMNDPEGVGSPLLGVYTGPSTLPKAASQLSLMTQGPDLSQAAFQNVQSPSVLAPMLPTAPHPPSAFSEVVAPARNTAGAGPGVAAERHKYLLLVKGADSSMMEIVNMHKKSNARVKEKMLSELDAMAQLGLRTLVLGQRHLSEDEVLAWLPVFHEAQCSMQDRSEKLHQAYALLERDVDIVGTTAVEDKLQDEVPQTLDFCIQASIVVWMLTGDKRETAVTIAHTSGLVSADHTNFVCHLDVSDIVEEETLWKQQKRYEAHARTTNEDSSGDEESSEDDNSGDVSPLPFKAPGQSSDGQKNSTNGGAPHKSEPVVTAGNVLDVRDGSAAAASTGPQPEEVFLERKVARIEAQLAAAEEKCSEGEEVFDTHTVVVVVDGKTLDFIFADNTRANRFFVLGSRCRSAVCCRMTPLQKAKIVRMFKRNMKAVALAIGDGANDVSMIQESSIGVGIMGLEGSQAELASDYAIPKFRFLKRLLFVHGRFSLFRDAHCIVYSLYKNVIVTVGMIAYQFYACYSGQTLIDSWLLAMFSIFFCSLQPLLIGILDKDVEDELAETLPQLYPPLSREFMYFSFPYIAKWLIDGMVEGSIFFFVLMYTVGVQDNLYPHMTPSLEDYGMTFFTMLVLVADLRAGTLVTYYMIIFVVAVLLPIIFVPIIKLIYSAMSNLAGSNWSVRMANELYGTSGKFWMMIFFACSVMVVITLASNMYIQLFHPWQNAGFVVQAARRSSHRVPYEHMKKKLREEYAQLLARYEELHQRQEQQAKAEDGSDGTVADVPANRRGAARSSGGEAAKPSA